MGTEVEETPAQRVVHGTLRLVTFLANAQQYSAWHNRNLAEIREARCRQRTNVIAAFTAIQDIEDDVNAMNNIDAKLEFSRAREILTALRFQRVGPPSPKPPQQRKWGEKGTFLIHPTLAASEIGNAARAVRMLRFIASRQ